MPYPSSGAVIRSDINTVVEEAYAAESFFIGPTIMPPFSVPAKSGIYPKLKIGAARLLDNVATDRNPDGSYNEIVRRYDTDTYDAVDRGLEERVDDAAQRDLNRFFNYEATAAKLTLRNVQLQHETRVAAAIMNTTNFGAGTNSAVAYTVANLATINVPLDIITACGRVADNGARPNTIVMSETILNRIATSTLLTNFIRGTLKGAVDMPVNAANIANAFSDYGITQCLIGRARVNSANKAQTASMSQVWGNTYIWVGYSNPGAGLMTAGGAGFTLFWNPEGGLFVTETYRDEKRRSDIVRVRQHTAEKVVDGTAGTLITTQYS
jgi:hypothetical protein